MKHLSYLFLLLVPLSTFSQVRLAVEPTSLVLDPSDEFSVNLSVSGFNELTSAQFAVKWDPTVLSILETSIPVDTFSTGSPFGSSFSDSSSTFLFVDNSGLTSGYSIADGSVLLKLKFKAIGNRGDSSCIEFASNPSVEFIKNAAEELNVLLDEGCVHLQTTGASVDHEQKKLMYHLDPSGLLKVWHPSSDLGADIQLFNLSGQQVLEHGARAFSTSTTLQIPASTNQRTLVLRYTVPNLQQTILITRAN